jgi:hypothetical protein
MNSHPSKSGKRTPGSDATKRRSQRSTGTPIWQRLLQRLSQLFGGKVEGRTPGKVPITAKQRPARRAGK